MTLILAELLLMLVGTCSSNVGVQDSQNLTIVIQSTEILKKIENGELVEYKNVIVEGNLDFNELDLPTENAERTTFSAGPIEDMKVIKVPIIITDSEIRGEIAFGSSIFLEKINFRNTNFAGNASFSGSKFTDDADFAGSKFAGENANFLRTKFLGAQSDFGYAEFSGEDAKFGGAEFSGGDANFEGVVFSSDTDFRIAKFSGGDANFLWATFAGSCTDFRFSEFSGGDANFGWANFSSGDSNFKGTKFSGGDTNFRWAKFSVGDANFSFTKISGGDANFRGAKFSGGDANFEGTEFSGGDANFGKSKRSDENAIAYLEGHIGNDPDFSIEEVPINDADIYAMPNYMMWRPIDSIDFANYSQLYQLSILSYMLFRDDNYWSKLCNANFSGGDANFRNTEFSGGDANFRNTEFSGGDANFEGAEFSSSEADFKGAEFLGGDANFRDAKFSGGDANFEGANFNNDLEFTGIEFNTLIIEMDKVDHLICNSGITYLKLIKNLRDLDQFDAANDVYYQYRKWKMTSKAIEHIKTSNKLRSNQLLSPINPPNLLIPELIAVIIASVDSSMLLDFMAWISCGYGVKPFRPLILGILIIGICAAYYKSRNAIRKRERSSHQETSSWDALYFSIITFTTMSYGDWYPLDEYRTVVTIEGVFGWLTLSLFIVTLARVMII
jgi:uncharacterized protein YjbI with pentapeptide repeats